MLTKRSSSAAGIIALLPNDALIRKARILAAARFTPAEGLRNFAPPLWASSKGPPPTRFQDGWAQRLILPQVRALRQPQLSAAGK